MELNAAGGTASSRKEDNIKLSQGKFRRKGGISLEKGVARHWSALEGNGVTVLGARLDRPPSAAV